MALRVSLLVLLVLAAACQPESSTDTSAPAQPTATAPAERDVCGMLTMDELKTAAGLTEASGQSLKSGGADVCTWTASGRSVIVQVYPYASAYDSARSAFESQYGATAEEVTAVGDKAFYIDGKTGQFATGTLVAQKGSTPISVQVMGGTGDAATRKGETTAIAHVILGKL